MKKHKMPDIKEGGVNITPLIDVVMCLIIFFMLVAKIGVSTGAEEMDIPESIQGLKIEDMGNTLTLNIRPVIADQPLVTALVEGTQAEIKIVDPVTKNRQLFNVLTKFRSRNEQLKVIIRAPRDMPYRYLESVLLTCADARVKNVCFNTRQVSEVVTK